MNEMTLPSGHRIRDSSLSGPSASTLPLQAPHNIESSRLSVEDLNVGTGYETRDLRLFKQRLLYSAAAIL